MPENDNTTVKTGKKREFVTILKGLRVNIQTGRAQYAYSNGKTRKWTSRKANLDTTIKDYFSSHPESLTAWKTKPLANKTPTSFATNAKAPFTLSDDESQKLQQALNKVEDVSKEIPTPSPSELSSEGGDSVLRVLFCFFSHLLT